jgi:hypothetical protein
VADADSSAPIGRRDRRKELTGSRVLEEEGCMLRDHAHTNVVTVISWPLIVLMAVLCLPLAAVAEGMQGMAGTQGAAADANELSKEMVNPIGPHWLINTYLNVIQKEGNAAGESRTSVEWLIQPVMPIPLNDTGLKLMNRPALPLFFTDPVPTDRRDIGSSGLDSLTGIGDLTIQSSLGKMQPTDFGMYMWGVGVDLIFPTASEDGLGGEKYSAGPVGMLVGFTPNYTFGTVLSHVWSYAGSDSRADVNRTQVQFMYFKQLGSGWQIGDNPTWSIKAQVDHDEKYDIPIGLGIFKTALIAGSPWRLGLTPRYYLESYDNWGSDWGVSFTITPVVRNPFM